MSNDFDVVVIGAGIIGAACAFELNREGLRVLVLDASRAASGSSGRCMGHVVAMDDNPAILDLTVLSGRLWRELATDYAEALEYNPCGTVWISADEEEMEAARSKADNYSHHGLTIRLLNEQALYKLEPNLSPGLVGGLEVADDIVVYPPTCIRLFLEDLKVLGNHRVQKIVDHAVVLEDGSEIRGDRIINAAGVAAPLLIPELPIQPRKGHLVITDRYPGFCHHQLVELGYVKSAEKMEAESVAFNLQPRFSGQCLVGSSRELVGWDDSINRTVAGNMLERACAYMPSLRNLSAIRTWVGFRPATLDKLPLIGRWPLVQGLYIAAGHEGLGITTALGTARLLADDILERTPPIDPAPFQAERVLKDVQP